MKTFINIHSALAANAPDKNGSQAAGFLENRAQIPPATRPSDKLRGINRPPNANAGLTALYFKAMPNKAPNASTQ